jgi:hypothetical protein
MSAETTIAYPAFANENIPGFVRLVPTLVPKPGSLIVTQEHLPRRIFDALRALGLSQVTRSASDQPGLHCSLSHQHLSIIAAGDLIQAVNSKNESAY